MKKRGLSRKFWERGGGILVLCLLAGLVWADKVPRVGSPWPKFQLKAPAGKEERTYLGIGNSEKFSVQQIPAPFLIIEILGVYCPLCHTQGPFFNRLYYQIQKDPALHKNIRMLAIAAGANPTEVSYIRQELQIPFPVFEDPKFEIHKLLGEPKTPTTLILNGDRKVIFFHVGVIEDINAFYKTIKNLTL
jgi:hypothetical protein